jgi:hypothetical protein
MVRTRSASRALRRWPNRSGRNGCRSIYQRDSGDERPSAAPCLRPWTCRRLRAGASMRSSRTAHAANGRPAARRHGTSRPIQTSISGRVVVGVPQEHAARRIRVIRVGLLRWRRISVASTLWAVASIFYEQLAWLFFVVRVVKPWSVSSHTASADESRLTSGVNGESRPAS